jgi:hypothetical protein
MKKKLILLLITFILISPITVKAANITYYNSTYRNYFTNYSYGALSERVYIAPGYEGSPVFCIDAYNRSPKYYTHAYKLSMDTNLNIGLTAIYRVYLITKNKAYGGASGALTAANDAMRIFVIRGGYYRSSSTWWVGNGVTNNALWYAFYNSADTLAGWSKSYSNYPTISYSRSNNYELVQAMYCAAAKVSGWSSGSTSTCQKAISNWNIDIDLLKTSNFDVSLTEDTTVSQETYDETKSYSKLVTFKLGGTGYENMKKLFDKYSNLRDISSITATSCEVDEASKAAGFGCKLVDASNLIASGSDGTQKVEIYNNNSILTTATVKATVNFKVKFPYNSSSLTLLSCSGSGCRDGYTTQRLLVINASTTVSTDTNITTTAVAACKSVVKDNKVSYYLGDKEVSETEYLNAGCCDVDYSYLTEEDSQEYYRNFCQSEDIVSLENECGTKSVLENKTVANVIKDEDNVFSNIETTTCTTESYDAYTESKIMQVGINKVLEKVETLEDGAYAENNENMSENSAISNNLDKVYVNTAQTGTDGTTLNPISSGNTYCMMYTSEDNNIYFPGTAVSTSGRFFVFNELNNEECANSEEPSSTCFRQPYIVGKIDGTFHTNYTKWDTDYQAAIEAEKNAWNGNANDATYKAAKAKRELLEQYKTECEEHANLKNYWSYELSPTLSFSYTQKTYGSTESITETVPMEISYSAVKYWPNTTKSATCSYQNLDTSSKNTYTISYGNINETKTFSSVADSYVSCSQTLYYKPSQTTYATIPTGEYIVANNEYQTTSTLIENGLEIGYVYNVNITAYQAAYTTSFTIDNVGHRGASSNIQTTLEAYKKENNLTEISSECVYCNTEGLYSRVCDECDDPDDPPLTANYIYRTISLSDVTPNDRENTNWSDEKGAAAEAAIQALSGPNVVAALSLDSKTEGVTTLNEASETSTKATVLDTTTGNTYTDEYLEYDFTLTTSDMQLIKKNSSRSEFDYGTMNMCTGTDNTTAKSADADYCFTCNSDGKECTSTFIDAFADSTTTTETRASKWKYYINNEWVSGSMSTISAFENGRYPDPTNQEAYLKIHSNWP